MCGRYAINVDLARLCQELKLGTKLQQIHQTDNACPGSQQPVIIHDQLGMALWGFPPVSADARPMINIRSETVHQKPSYADSWNRSRRCLIPATSFYEWAKDDAGVKHKYEFIPSGTGLVTFAGLWSMREGAPCFAILTQSATGNAEKIYKRFPVVVNFNDHETYFKGSADTILKLMQKNACDAFEISISEQ